MELLHGGPVTLYIERSCIVTLRVPVIAVFFGDKMEVRWQTQKGN
jgi:hypothetical protein